jgi:hypothetical protein
MAARVDPPFIALEVAPAPRERETAHALEFWRRENHRRHQVSGILSAKFSRKTRLRPPQFVEFIEQNPGYDVWFVNPWPHLRYFAFNIWEQGEEFHPGLLRRAGRLLEAANQPIAVEAFPRSRVESLLFCNFWAGTEAFWDRFMRDVQSLWEAAQRVPDVYDPTDHYTDVTFFPFILERYFTTFLEQNRDIRACAWRHSPDEVISRCGTSPEIDFLKHWMPIIDQWDLAGTYTLQQRQVFRDSGKLSRQVYDASRSQRATQTRRS